MYRQNLLSRVAVTAYIFTILLFYFSLQRLYAGTNTIYIRGIIPANKPGPTKPIAPPPIGSQWPLTLGDRFYDYDAQVPPGLQTKTLQINKLYTEYELTYPTAAFSAFPVNNDVTSYLYVPSIQGRHPAVLVIHPWAPSSLGSEHSFCRQLAMHGIASMLMVLPYSMNRRPYPHYSDTEIISSNLPHMAEAMRQAILDARLSIDILCSRSDIDSDNIGAAGFSLGGFISSMLSRVDNRIHTLYLVMAGAGLSDILWKSYLLRWVQAGFDRRGYTYDDIKEFSKPLDITLRSNTLNRDDVLLIDGRYDVFIAPQHAKALSAAFDNAPIIWSNTGHFGMTLFAKQANDIGVKFFRSRFGLDQEVFTPPSRIQAPLIKLGFIIGGREGGGPCITYQVLGLNNASSISLDTMITQRGLSAGLFAKTTNITGIGLQYPLFDNRPVVRPYMLLHIVY